MNFTITGSLGNISKPLAEKLIAAGHQVTIISRNAGKIKEIEEMGGTAAIGSIEDAAFLTETFQGKDAIYTMVPPNYSATDINEYIAGVGDNYLVAIQASGVKRVINLSSIGADLDGGTGPISGLHSVEQRFSELDGVAVKHLRPGYFYLNFLGSIDMIKQAGILGSNYGLDTSLLLAHPDDIAAAAAEEMQKGFQGQSVRYVTSDECTAADIASKLGAAIGKPELPWVTFGDEDVFKGMVQAGLPEEMAKSYVEMGNAIRTGKLFTHYFDHKPSTFGKVKLDDFAVEFARDFNDRSFSNIARQY